MINSGVSLQHPAMRSAVGATSTPTTMRASSISTTTGPTTRTTSSVSADPRQQRPGAGNASEGHLLGRETPGAQSPKAWPQAQPGTVARPAGVATEDGNQPRILCQFSCGAASAVATKLALAEYGSRCVIVNAFIEEEHKDNRRFALDCEKWFDRDIVNLRDTKYNASAIQVFETVGYIKGPKGASCTSRIKRGLLRTFEQPGDILVLGYTAEEQPRLDDWLEDWPDRPIIAPLIERGLTKEDCKAMVERAGIRLPMMYELGYDNANCIGCVKGGGLVTSAPFARISLCSLSDLPRQKKRSPRSMAMMPSFSDTGPGH